MKAEPLHRGDEVVGIPRIHLWPTLDCLAHEAGQFNASPGDLSGLTERLVQLARDPALCERLGRRGQELVKQWFPVERMVDQLHDLYLKLSTRYAIPPNP